MIATGAKVMICAWPGGGGGWPWRTVTVPHTARKNQLLQVIAYETPARAIEPRVLSSAPTARIYLTTIVALPGMAGPEKGIVALLSGEAADVPPGPIASST